MVDRVVEKLEWMEIDELVLPEWNPKPHEEENLTAIRKSIERFGMVVPLVVDKKTKLVIDGSGRYKVLKKLIDEGKWKFGRKVPVVLVDVSDEEEMKKIVVALQKVMDEPDPDRLLSLLTSITATPEEFSVMGLTPTEISLLTFSTPTVPDIGLPTEIFPLPVETEEEEKTKKRGPRISLQCSDETLAESLYERLRGLKIPREVWGDVVAEIILNLPPHQIVDTYVNCVLKVIPPDEGEPFP